MAESRIRVSRLAQSIPPSETLATSAKVRVLQSKGVPVIDLTVGEPHLDPPQVLRDKAKEAVDLGLTRYKHAPVNGSLELRTRIARKFREENGIDYSPEEVTIGNGAKGVLDNAFTALLDPGDEVLIISPYWVTTPQQVRLAGGTPVFVPTDRDFMPTVEGVEAKITSKTKVLSLNSPNNPTGTKYREKLLRGFADLAITHDLVVVDDGIYEYISFDGQKHVSIASLGDEIRARTISVNGHSKSHSIPGWRDGYAGGPENAINVMNNVQSQRSGGPSAITQYVALAAFDVPFDSERLESFRVRRDLMVREAEDLGTLSLPKPPEGAFYGFLEMSEALMDKLRKRADASKYGSVSEIAAGVLLDEAHVAVMPGKPFGSDRHIRVSNALKDPDDIPKAFAKIRDAF